MKSLYTAAAVTLAPGAFLFIVLSLLTADQKLSDSIAGLFLAAFPTVAAAIEKREQTAQVAKDPGGALSFMGLSIPWYLILAYATAILAAVGLLAGLVSGVVEALVQAGIPGEFAGTGYDTITGNLIAQASIITLNLVAFPIVAYLVGSWIATRCEKYGPYVAVGSVFIALLLIRTLDLLAIDETSYEQLYGQKRDFIGVVPYLFLWTTIYGAFSLLGYWRSNQAKLGRYVAYLMRRLPEATKDTIVAWAYQEAQLAASQALAASTMPPVAAAPPFGVPNVRQGSNAPPISATGTGPLPVIGAQQPISPMPPRVQETPQVDFGNNPRPVIGNSNNTLPGGPAPISQPPFPVVGSNSGGPPPPRSSGMSGPPTPPSS